MSSSDPDIGSEREVDLTRWREAVVSRWWIVAAGLAAGLVVGALYSLSGGSLWEASVLIAPGQAFSPSGSPVLVYASSPRNINEIATQESTIEKAAKEAHMPTADLRGHVSTAGIPTGLGSTSTRGSTLIRITVRSSKPKQTEDAANAIARIVIDSTTSPYVKQSLATYASKISSYNAGLASLNNVIAQYNKVINGPGIDQFNKLILVNELDAALARQANLNDKLTATQAEQTLAQNIEITQLIPPPAAAAKTTARSRRNSVLVGALIGLILGAIAGIVADTRMRRAQT